MFTGKGKLRTKISYICITSQILAVEGKNQLIAEIETKFKTGSQDLGFNLQMSLSLDFLFIKPKSVGHFNERTWNLNFI